MKFKLMSTLWCIYNFPTLLQTFGTYLLSTRPSLLLFMREWENLGWCQRGEEWASKRGEISMYCKWCLRRKWLCNFQPRDLYPLEIHKKNKAIFILIWGGVSSPYLNIKMKDDLQNLENQLTLEYISFTISILFLIRKLSRLWLLWCHLKDIMEFLSA